MEEGGCFSDGGLHSSGGGGAPWGALVLMGGFLKKIDGWQVPPPMPLPPLWETLKPFIKKGLLEEMEWVDDNASAFVHLNIKINNGKKLLFKPSRVIYVRKLSFNFMVMQIRKPENEGTFLGSNEKKNAGKEQGQDWSKICWKEVENEQF